MAALKIALSHLVLCALLGVIGINGKPPSAIIDGGLADDNEFPYQVSLSIYGQHTCGGSIIDSLHILTAAHCVRNVSTAIKHMKVTAGTNYVNVGGGDDHRIKKVTLHPEFSREDHLKNDIAVVTLSSPITLDDRRRPVKLPTSDIPADTQVTACGWGDTVYPDGLTPSALRKLSMVVVPNRKCRPPKIKYIRDTNICAYSRKGAGLCTGDSGGALLNDGTLIGIASYVVPCGTGLPDVFTRVYKYVDWINEVTEMKQ